MNRQRTPKTPRYVSLEPEQIQILGHSRIRDIPQNADFSGDTQNGDVVVFKIGSKRDKTSLRYVSFEEAKQDPSFKKYLHSFLIPTIAKPHSKSVTYIYRGDYDYTTILENEQSDEKVGPADENVDPADENDENVDPVEDGQIVPKAADQNPPVENAAVLNDAEEEEIIVVDDTTDQRPKPAPSRKRPLEEETPKEYGKRRKVLETPALVFNEHPETPSTCSAQMDHSIPDLSKTSSSSSISIPDPSFFQSVVSTVAKCIQCEDDKFVKSLMFTEDCPEIELAAHGIDPHFLPPSLSLNFPTSSPNVSSPSSNETFNSTASPIFSRSIEVDEEPDEEEMPTPSRFYCSIV